MASGTEQTAETVQHRDGIQTICTGCGATAPGIRPPGWLVFGTWGRVGGVKAIVGEVPWCPDCRRQGRVEYPLEEQ